MSKKFSNALMTIAMGMAATSGHSFYEVRDENIGFEEKERRKNKAKKAIKKANGLTEFKYGDKSVWALNKKNADRKAKAKGYL